MRLAGWRSAGLGAAGEIANGPAIQPRDCKVEAGGGILTINFRVCRGGARGEVAEVEFDLGASGMNV